MRKIHAFQTIDGQTPNGTTDTMSHESTYPIPPYSFLTDDELIDLLDSGDGDDELLMEIRYRQRKGEWLS